MSYLFAFSYYRDVILLTKVHLVKAMVYPVVMYGCASWTIKKKNVGPSPKNREAGRAVLKEELSASFRRQSRDSKLQEAELGFPSLPNSHFLSACPWALTFQ